jgi:hypothetical protein
MPRKSWLAIAAVFGLAVVLPSGASSDSSKDKIKGHGENNPPVAPINSFSVEAESGPSGEDPKGRIKFKSVNLDPKKQFTADVLCLRVEGNKATLVGLIEKDKNNPSVLDRYIVVFAEDLGDPPGKETVDRIRNGILPEGSPQPDCPPPVTPPVDELTKGDIRITDAT